MYEHITKDNIRSYAYISDEFCKSPRGVALDFFGLGGDRMFTEEPPVKAAPLAEKGILLVYPFYNPWCWMNDLTVKFVDRIVEIVYEMFSLPNSTPLASCGDSMGGLSALVYTGKASRIPDFCLCNCPVCDLETHFTERVDLPRTLTSAFAHTGKPITEALRDNSPLRMAADMPKIPYVIFHCECDSAVNIDIHTRPFVNAMLKSGHDIKFITVPNNDHCDLGDKYGDYIEYMRSF